MNRCDICGQPFKPGSRILWRLKPPDPSESVGFSATHIICPRMLAGLALGALLLALLLAVLILFV